MKPSKILNNPFIAFLPFFFIYVAVAMLVYCTMRFVPFYNRFVTFWKEYARKACFYICATTMKSI